LDPSVVSSLHNPLIHPDTKQILKKFHWQIHVVATPMNNDFMLWLVKGYIVEVKGHDVNWAKATTSMTKEKA
jgi:hypothetical protein